MSNRTVMGIIIFLIIRVSLTFASERGNLLGDPFPSLRTGIGARSLAMGGTGVVVSEAMEAVLWNPAGCQINEKWMFQFSGNDASRTPSAQTANLPKPQSFFFGGGRNWSEWCLAISGYYYTIWDLEVIDVNSITGAPRYSTSKDESLKDIAVVLTTAWQLKELTDSTLSIGANLIFYRRELYDLSTDFFSENWYRKNWGCDLGAKYLVSKESDKIPEITLGVRFRHLYGVSWKEKGDIEYTDNSWSYLDFGGSVQKNNVIIALQSRFDQNEDCRLSGGFEYQLNLLKGENQFFDIGISDILIGRGSAPTQNTALTFGFGWDNIWERPIDFHICFRSFDILVPERNRWRSFDGQVTFEYKSGS
ncbi:hypothetical protein K9N50_02495 [bacterium]|nr:hypothetical protein [bacterium]